MQLMSFRIYTVPTEPVTGHDTTDLVILPADRMRAERESTNALHPSQRGPGAAKAHPETWVLLWLWCAATRMGLTSAKFPDWSVTVLDYDRLDADGNVPERDDQDVEGPELDPTNGAGATT